MLFKHGLNDPYWTFEKLSELENSLGVKSSYYFLNESGKVNPLYPKSWLLYGGRYRVNNRYIREQLRELSTTGHEIGLHGSYNSFRSHMLLAFEKQLIESVTGSEVAGIRQHYLNYDRSITPNLHRDCGFKYDSSVGFKPATGIGFRRGTSFPFHIMLSDFSISPVMEIPLIIMDSSVGSTATAKDCFNILGKVEKYNGVLTILWHSNMFNRREYPDLFELYQQIVKEAIRKDAWIATAKDVCNWLNDHEISSQRSLDEGRI